jgi:hypothetical protein
MRAVVRIWSAVGIAAHGYFFVICLCASGLSDAPPESSSAWIPFLMPFVYFTFCFITSFRFFRGPFLLLSGIVAHLIVVPFYYHAVRDRMGLIAIVPLILALCWFCMCLQRKEYPK